MTTNKVTKLYSAEGLLEETIQEHFDEQNALNYYLVAADRQGGWYRFFWAKDE